MKKVIFILIDALGAVYFAAHRDRLPFMSTLASNGLFVDGVQPATPGTSRPGRATILTGRDTSAHGVYGNSVLEDGRFRPANEHDVQGITVANLAQQAGLRVAGLGFGMLRPEETDLHVDPWWEHLEYNGLTNIKVPANANAWDIAPIRRDNGGRLASLLATPLTKGNAASPDVQIHPVMAGIAADQLMLQTAGDLACGDDPPDLILTEFSTTDVVQHHHGFDAALTHWAYQAADMAIGLLLHRLRTARRIDDYVLVIASDHGHAPIHTAVYPETFVPHGGWSSEGASMHILVRDEAEMARLNAVMTGLGGIRLEGSHLPKAIRDQGLATFVAPKGFAFERRHPSTPANTTTGSPLVISTHGLAPDDPEDRAIAIVSGAGLRGRVVGAHLGQVAPTIGRILGLPTQPFPAQAWQ